MSSETSLIDYLKRIPDPRHPNGRRHPLWFILLIIIMGIMSGYWGYRGLGTFVERHRLALIEIFSIFLFLETSLPAEGEVSTQFSDDKINLVISPMKNMSNTVDRDFEITEAKDREKYGEREIAEGKLITFPNPRIGRKYHVNITLPEFTCKCPFSGYPDFATIYLTYCPNEKVVELKSIKLYINSYRDLYIPHEEVVNQILDDFVAAADPLEVNIKGDFNPRGNVRTTIEVSHKKNPE